MQSNSLLSHIEALNAKTLAWIAESPETRGGGLIHTDLAYWAECGVTDVDSFERWCLATDIYYTLKDECLHADWSELFSRSLKELQAEMRSLCEEAKRLNFPHNY